MLEYTTKISMTLHFSTKDSCIWQYFMTIALHNLHTNDRYWDKNSQFVMNLLREVFSKVSSNELLHRIAKAQLHDNILIKEPN